MGWRFDWSFACVIAPAALFFAPIKPADSGSPGKMAIKTERKCHRN